MLIHFRPKRIRSGRVINLRSGWLQSTGHVSKDCRARVGAGKFHRFGILERTKCKLDENDEWDRTGAIN